MSIHRIPVCIAIHSSFSPVTMPGQLFFSPHVRILPRCLKLQLWGLQIWGQWSRCHVWLILVDDPSRMFWSWRPVVGLFRGLFAVMLQHTCNLLNLPLQTWEENYTSSGLFKWLLLSSHDELVWRYWWPRRFFWFFMNLQIIVQPNLLVLSFQ